VEAISALLKVHTLVTQQFAIDRSTASSPPKNRKQLLRELAATVAGLRLEAKGAGLDKMSMREINAIVAGARCAKAGS
jgi:hypothetical protein